MGIKPLEKKKTNGLVPKLIFLIALLCVGLAIDIVSKNVRKNKPEVLSASQPQTTTVNPIQDVKQMTDGLVRQTETSAASVLSLATQVIQNTASKSSALVSGLIYDNTFGKLVDQVKSLPPDQQQRIKEQICK